MSKIVTLPITCPDCHITQDCSLYATINVKINPELKEIFLANKFNTFTCSQCKKTALLDLEFIYHDMDKKFQVWFTKNEPQEQWLQSIETVKQHLGPEHYAANPLITHNRTEAVFMVALCENNGPPHTDEQRSAYYEVVKGLLDIAK